MNQLDNKLKNLSACDGRSEFTRAAMEFTVPKNAQVVFVSDLFESDYAGGAELTSEALLLADSAPQHFFRVHSHSLTVEMLEKNREKKWIIANFTQCDVSVLKFLPSSGIDYTLIEYDYKMCVYRSEVMHKMQTGKECDCPESNHGPIIELLHKNARNIFWMSENQRNHFHSRMPALKGQEDKNIILSSVFKEKDLSLLLALGQNRKYAKKLPIDFWAVQNSQNWIKGTKETMEACNKEGKATRLLGNMPYPEFLKTLSTCHGLVFRPLDKDTCPRVVIEAKIIGLDLSLNDNVQHKDEPWFQGTPEEVVAYLRGRASFFWSHFTF